MTWKPSEDSIRPAIGFCLSVAVMGLGSFWGWSPLFWAVTGAVAFAAACFLIWRLAEDNRRPGFQIGLWEGHVTTEPPQVGQMADGHVVRTIGVFVREAKGRAVDDATIYLEHLWNAGGWHSRYARMPLLLENQLRDPRGDMRINFGPREDKRVLLCGLDETKPDSDIFFYYANRTLPSAVPRGEYFARIKIVGGAKPARAVFRLWVNEEGKLSIALHHVR